MKTAAKVKIARRSRRGKTIGMSAKNVSGPGKKYANDNYSNLSGGTNNTLSGKALKQFGAAKLGQSIGTATKSRHTKLSTSL